MAGSPIMNGITNGSRATAPTASTTTAGGEDGASLSSAAAAALLASLEEGRGWLERRRDGRPPLSHTSMRAWLVRAMFMLLAATILLATTLGGLGLLGAGEIAIVLAPVATLAAAIFGFYLGDGIRD
jgi:hypothetical protein